MERRRRRRPRRALRRARSRDGKFRLVHVLQFVLDLSFTIDHKQGWCSLPRREGGRRVERTREERTSLFKVEGYVYQQQPRAVPTAPLFSLSHVQPNSSPLRHHHRDTYDTGSRFPTTTTSKPPAHHHSARSGVSAQLNARPPSRAGQNHQRLLRQGSACDHF